MVKLWSVFLILLVLEILHAQAKNHHSAPLTPEASLIDDTLEAEAYLDAGHFHDYLLELFHSHEHHPTPKQRGSDADVPDSFVQETQHMGTRFDRCRKLLNTWIGKCVFGDPSANVDDSGSASHSSP